MRTRITKFFAAWEIIIMFLSLKAGAIAFIIAWAFDANSHSYMQYSAAFWAMAWGIGNSILGLSATVKPWKVDKYWSGSAQAWIRDKPKQGWL